MYDEASAAYEDTYLAVLDLLPVSVWIEDWSPVKAMIDELGRDGPVDWRRYFERHRHMTIEAANMIDVIDVNQATLLLYGANSKEEVIESTLGEKMASGELLAFREQLIAFAEGDMRFTIDADEETMDDTEIRTRIHAGIVPAARDDWSIVYCIIEENTAAARGERADPTDVVCQEDLAYWEEIKDSPKAEDYDAYLEAFPGGIFAPLARRRTRRMSAEVLDLSPAAIIPSIGMDFDQLNERARKNSAKKAKSKAAKSLI
jgi:hypothetical protein